MVNRYLLVLLMLWTKQDARIYHDSLGMRKRIVLTGAIKKAAVQKHVQSHREMMEGLLKEEVEKRIEEVEKRKEAEQQRKEAEQQRKEAEQRMKEMQKQIEALEAEKEGNPEKKRKLA